MECYQPIPVSQTLINVTHWTREGSERKQLNITVYPDDTMVRLLTKIAHAMGETRLPYAWKSKPLLFAPSGSWIGTGYHVNPWKSTNRDNASQDKPKLSFRFHELVASTSINITFIEDVPKELQNDYYFPDLGIKIPSKTALGKEETLLDSLWLKQSSDLVTNGSCTYVHVTYAGKMQSTDVVLADVFASVNANKEIPFVQWVDDRARVLYKLYEQHSIPASNLKLWTDYDRLPVLDDVINLYASFKSNFVRCSIDSQGNVQIIYRIDSRDKLSLETIDGHFTKLSQHMTSILKTRLSLTMADISLRTELYRNDITLKSFGAVISTALPIFHITELTSSTLSAIYKRSSNYKTIDITESIRGLLKFGNAPVEEVVQRIMNTYGFTLAEATSYVDQATSMDDVATNKKIETGISVQIAPIALGFRISIEQAPSLAEARCVLHWLRSCLHRASKKAKGVVAKPVARLPPVRQPTPSKSSSPASKSEKSLSDSLSVGGAIGKEYQGHFLRMLQKADPKIFVENGNYARMCMVTNYRQPVVISAAEKAALDKSEFGQAVDNFMEYGSDPQNKNVYFCPRIWCPESKVPMTYEQYNKYKVCPKGENPIMMYDHSYWDNDPKVKHNIGFHSTKGNNGLCLPCCMKREKKPATFEKELKECASPFIDETKPPKNVKTKAVNAPPPAIEEEPIKEEYYLMTQGAPLPKGRYGTIPKPLHNALYPNISHAMCSKVLTSQECLVRKGIDHESDSLLAAIASSLGLPSKKELVKTILKRIDPIVFLTLEHGNILTLFAPENPLVPHQHVSMVKRWNAWVKTHKKYVSLLQLDGIIDKQVSQLDDGQLLVLSRELAFFDAYERFIQYFKSEEPKNPYLMYDVLRHLDVLLLLWEKQDNDNAHLYCPFYTTHEELLDAVAGSQQAILLLKDGEIYEPLELKQRNKKGVETIPFTTAQRMIDMLHSCKHDGVDNNMRTVVASLIAYDMWLDQALTLPSQFRIQTLVIGPNMRITYGMTKSNILITFPTEGIAIGYLQRIMNDLKINKVVYHEDIEGTNVTCKFVATDLQLVMNKLSTFGFGLDAGKIVTTMAIQNAIVYETLMTIPMCTEFPVLKALSSVSTGYAEKDRKWHQLQTRVGKTFLGHYETLIQALHGKTRTARVRILMNTFPDIPDRAMLQAVIEEMPLEYDNKQVLANWLRRVSYPQKYPFLDPQIHKQRSQYIFSQVAVEKGLPQHIVTSAKGPRPSSTLSPQIDAQEEKELIPPSNFKLLSTGMPETIRTVYEALPSKWTQIKSYEWATFKMGKIQDFSPTIMWELLEWVSTSVMMPIKRDELKWLRNKMVYQSLKDVDMMNIFMEDPSFLQHWNDAYGKKYVDGKQLMQRGFIPQMKNHSAVVSTWTSITEKDTLWPSALELYIFSKVVQCNVLLLHRAPYGEGNKKRGDIQDLGISSTFYTKEYTESYVATKPLFIFYKVSQPTHVEFMPVIDANGTFLHKSVNLSPKDVRDLIAYHIQHKTNKMK